MSSIKQNFALNLINTISGLLFPLVTFPYASRILLADGIGQVQFFQGIIGYISLARIFSHWVFPCTRFVK